MAGPRSPSGLASVKLVSGPPASRFVQAPREVARGFTQIRQPPRPGNIIWPLIRSRGHISSWCCGNRNRKKTTLARWIARALLSMTQVRRRQCSMRTFQLVAGAGAAMGEQYSKIQRLGGGSVLTAEQCPEFIQTSGHCSAGKALTRSAGRRRNGSVNEPAAPSSSHHLERQRRRRRPYGRRKCCSANGGAAQS